MDVRSTLNRLLEATVAKAAAQARIDAYRDRLDVEARRRYAEEGAAPTWKAAGLGTARLDGADAPPKPYVRDQDEFCSWLAQRYPTEAVATIELDSDVLPDAIVALALAGVKHSTARVGARPGFVNAFLPGLELEVTPGEEVLAVDPRSGEIVPGLGASRSEPRLVVVLDRGRKADAIAEAEALLEVEEGDARVEAELTEEAVA